MDEKSWFEDYAGETVEDLLLMEGRYRIDSLIVALHRALDQKSFRLGDAALSEPENMVLAIEALETEVNNGGYGQFFCNSPEYVGRIVSDLVRIGCDETARITERAIQALGLSDLNPEAVRDRAEEADDVLDDVLDECNNAYFALRVDIAANLFEFVKKNKDKVQIP